MVWEGSRDGGCTTGSLGSSVPSTGRRRGTEGYRGYRGLMGLEMAPVGCTRTGTVERQYTRACVCLSRIERHRWT